MRETAPFYSGFKSNYSLKLADVRETAPFYFGFKPNYSFKPVHIKATAPFYLVFRSNYLFRGSSNCSFCRKEYTVNPNSIYFTFIHHLEQSPH